MKLSTRSRYGIRALIDIAMNTKDRPVLLKDVARRQQISTMYLEHLITPLIAAGLVRSTRGARGGVWLARSPENVKLSEIMKLLEGSLAPVECVDDPNYCERSETCVTRDVWIGLKSAMTGVLESKTLKDLVDEQRARTEPEVVMYYI